MKLLEGDIPLANLSHVGFAVRNAEKTVEFLSSVWSLGRPKIAHYETKKDDMIFGEPFKIKIIFVKFGALQLEIIEPLDETSVWAKFIAEKGEGVHHVAFGVSNYDRMVEKMEGQKPLSAAKVNGYRWCYYDTAPGGMIFEFREEYLKD